MTERDMTAEDATGAARPHLAAWNDDARAITRLALTGADPDARDIDGRTPPSRPIPASSPICTAGPGGDA